jgi:plastocyanin
MIGAIAVLSAIVFALPIAASSAAAATVEVHLKDQNFNPRTVAAKPGDTIVFRNDDGVLHSVLVPDNEALLAAHFIEPHTGYEVVIPPATDLGAYDLVCTVHINMKGTLQIIAQ